jgi:hypothetical protein
VNGLEAARYACAKVGLAADGIMALHEHATAVFVHAAGVVLRVGAPGNGPAVRRGVTVAAWLSRQGFPATRPLEEIPVVDAGGRPVSFWRYYPQDGRSAPPAAYLGRLLRELHTLPAPPVALPEYQPLAGLGRLVGSESGLPGDDLAWLRKRCGELVAEYQDVRTALGHGFIHGDAYPGNTLWDGRQAILGDWDEVATGPRELDLVNTCQGARFGRTRREVDDFIRAYGYDVRSWPDYPVLREIRDLHTLGSYIRRAQAGDRPAREELARRIKSLRDGDTAAQWLAASAG